jgi:transposase
LSTKIHAVVDANGLPIRLLLTAGQASDKTTFPALIDGVALATDIVADRGYFAQSIIRIVSDGRRRAGG